MWDAELPIIEQHPADKVLVRRTIPPPLEGVRKLVSLVEDAVVRDEIDPNQHFAESLLRLRYDRQPNEDAERFATTKAQLFVVDAGADRRFRNSDGSHWSPLKDRCVLASSIHELACIRHEHCPLKAVSNK